MKVLMTNNSLATRGGSESYLETVSSELRRLGHEVLFYSPDCGLVAERLRQGGFEVHDDVSGLLSDIDVIHGQHTNVVARVRERLPTHPLVFATHSWAIPIEDPIAELGAGAYVAFNELTRRRLAAHAATSGAEIVRLTQPVEVSFADGARDPVATTPRRAVAVSRRMTTVTTRLAQVCAGLGIEFQRIGGDDGESPDPRQEMLAADIVFAMGRTALEGMAAARAVVVIDETSFGGWVSTSSYAALEADGFTGLGLGEVGPQSDPGDGDLEALLRRYDPDLGTQARRLVTRHHAAQHHAAALVEIYTAVADTPATPPSNSAGAIALLSQDRFALEHRAVTAEWEVARLRNEVHDLRGELERRLQEREHLVGRLEGMTDRLRRARSRARMFRRQRDRARAALESGRKRWRRS
jgi:hypothetical protein